MPSESRIGSSGRLGSPDPVFFFFFWEKLVILGGFLKPDSNTWTNPSENLGGKIHGLSKRDGGFGVNKFAGSGSGVYR
jgi:hypothetical protein